MGVQEVFQNFTIKNVYFRLEFEHRRLQALQIISETPRLTHITIWGLEYSNLNLFTHELFFRYFDNLPNLESLRLSIEAMDFSGFPVFPKLRLLEITIEISNLLENYQN